MTACKILTQIKIPTTVLDTSLKHVISFRLWKVVELKIFKGEREKNS